MTRDHIAVRMAALAVSYKARINDLDAEDVARLHVQAEQLLEPGAPLLHHIAEFVVGHELAVRDPERLAELGERLRHAVDVDAMPDPIDAGRADIHG